ncbi:hypothetical protein KY290_007640 [Solanum tuberosum]|uniref:Uncharacterized protein n=1 Tax=Solanum tuberosum TaxID=4113 RepID=A0ABQ7W697_SOLTU|nr:hypothetical protein KY290_007640 [Solanum tuberosum]
MEFAQQQHQAANMQQQQQFGFHPQHQQFPPSVHGPSTVSLLSPHSATTTPSSNTSSPSSPSAFHPHMPPHHEPSPFHNPYNLWMATRPQGGPFNALFPSSSLPMMHPSNSMMSLSPLNASCSGSNAAGSAAMLGPPHLHQPPFPPFYEQQPSQHFD